MSKSDRFETNMSREIESHLEQATQDYIAGGMPPEEARLRARREFGGIDLAKEELRDTRSLRWLEDFLQDARFTLRTWRRNPGFAAGVVAVLALGLGSTTALFSVLDRILFRPLPYADPDRLVSFGEVLPTRGPTLGVDSPREIMRDRAYFQLWQTTPEPFEAVTSVSGYGASPCDLTEDRPERLTCSWVEANFFDVLGTRVSPGRNFTVEEDRKGAAPVAIITHALWQRRFGGDPEAAGETLQVDGKTARIVGVLPAGFEYPFGEPDLFLLEQLRPFDPNLRVNYFFTTIGRLKPGVTAQQATAAIAPLIDAGAKLIPQQLEGPIKARVRNLRDLEVGDASRTAWLVFAASGVFLLIVCVNATGLLLARFATRSREFEMRAALGAGKGRLARLALAESVLLATAAGGLGVFASWGLLKIFLRLAPTSIPKIEHASLDLRVFAVAAALSLACGVAIGLWPALASLRAGTIGAGSRSTAGLRRRARFALITTQVALTVGLLGASGLLLHSLWNLIRVPLGFGSEQTLTMTVTLSPAHYPNPQRQTALFEQVLARVQAAPGTIAASWSNASPLNSYYIMSGLSVDGAASESESGLLHARYVTPGYFETFRIPIVKGRAFLEADRDERPAAILSEAAERILFPRRSSLGHTVKSPVGNLWHEVVGVVRDVRSGGMTRDGDAEVYLIRNRDAQTMRSGVIAMRTILDASDATGLLKQALASLDPQLPAEIKTVTEQVAALTARPRFLAALLVVFAGLALLVAAAGLYAVASFLVTQRTRDIGVRMALGASPARIAKQVGGEAFYWIAAGAGLGYGLAQLAARALAAELFNVPATDAWSWVGTVGALAAALLLALIPPMRRAGSVDPAIALRAE
jgi:putative ABC transport system permease protein